MASSSPPSRVSRISRSSPSARRSYHSPATPKVELSDFLLESRNSPEAHKRGFEEAQRQHDRVLKTALHVFELHQIAEATRKIEEEEKQRQERAKAERKKIEDERRAEEQRLRDEARLQALKAEPIQKPPPQPAPPAPAKARADNESATVLNGVTSKQSLPNGLKNALKTPVAPSGFTFPSASTPTSTTPAVQQKVTPAPVAQQGLPGTAPAAVPNSVPPPQPQVAGGSTSVSTTSQPPALDRHVVVHKKLKELRKFLLDQAKSNPTLKAMMGDMRREIRKSIGQLTGGGLKENKVPVNKILTTIRDSLHKVPCQSIDPNEFLFEPVQQPVQGAVHNDPQLPSLFLYLLNILAKAVISQFINETGAAGDANIADSIGQVVAKVYAEEDFLWRGKSLIDMLIAKYRVVCPVLFGFRGNDKMEQARLRVGWKKISGHWIPEQEHSERMTGLGAGFAAMTLRDFSKAKKRNPWPPSVYWTAMARIINTPSDQISKTQCYVLKAMIAGFEEKFIHFYGNAAIAALRCALVDFPARVPEPSSASQALTVTAKTLTMNSGLRLDSV